MYDALQGLGEVVTIAPDSGARYLSTKLFVEIIEPVAELP
jgi:hypothetical protein